MKTGYTVMYKILCKGLYAMEPSLKQQVLKFKRARSNLLAAIIFTVVNTLLMFLNANISFLFSIFTPQLLFGIREDAMGLLLALIALAPFFVCWLLSQRRRAFMPVALILFSLDSLLFVYLAVSAGFEVSYLLDVAFHVWILFYLISGTVAWARLRGVDADAFHIALLETDNGVPMHQNTGALPQQSGGAPLRGDEKKGRILIAADYEGLQISVKRTYGLTELIVDGNVYDEFIGVFEPDYSLTAHMQDKKIVAMCKSLSGLMYLYVNDVLIAKKRRWY